MVVGFCEGVGEVCMRFLHPAAHMIVSKGAQSVFTNYDFHGVDIQEQFIEVKENDKIFFQYFLYLE